MTANFHLQGGPQLQRRLTAIGQAPKDLLRRVGIQAVNEAKHLAPARTGNLRRTIRIGELTDTHVEVKAGGQLNVGYAAAVEYGSRAHIIVPRQASVLAWGGPRTLAGGLRAGGRPTNFARRVRHPGTRPKPFLIPGFRKALDIVGLGGLVEAWNKAA